MRIALSVQRLVKQYRAGPRGRTAIFRALDSVTLSVGVGELVAIAGPRSSGKSTLLLCASGLVRPDGGSVSWFGTQLSGRLVPHGISYVPQRSAYYSFLTVREALEYYATLHDLQTKDRAAQVDHAVRHVSLEGYASRRVGTLTPQILQRLGLAQALIGSPRALLLDETVSGELLRSAEIRSALRSLASDGVTILLSAERQEDAEPVADRVIRLENGRVVTTVECAGFQAAESYSTRSAPVFA